MKYIRFSKEFLLVVLLLGVSLLAQAQATDYTVPEPPEGVDLQMVVARIGDDTITLEDFVERLRYERIRAYISVKDAVDQNGETILDPDPTVNQMASQVIDLADQLVSADQFGPALLEYMVIEWVYHQEVAARGLEVEQCQLDTIWATLLGLAEPVDCEVPEGFDQAKQEFIDMMTTYAGMTVEEVERVVTFREEATLAQETVGAEFTLPDDPVVQTRQIHVADLETAETVMERLAAGEDFRDLLVEFSIDEGVKGSGGALGTFSRGQMVAEFEEAAFSGEVGEIIGPVQTQFGYHIIEILEKNTVLTADLSLIVLATQEDAEQALRLLEDGANFAELASQFSIDMNTASVGGAMGTVTQGTLPEDIDAAVFAAQAGDVLGPFGNSGTFQIIQVNDLYEDAESLNARHILVETEEEAQEVLARLEAGEDFADLAFEYSIEPAAQGHGGDTLRILRGSAAQTYAIDEVPEEYAPAFDAEVGDILGPIEVEDGYLILEVQASEMRPASDAAMNSGRQSYLRDWQDGKLGGETVEMGTPWYTYFPIDPMPSAIYPVLEPLDAIIQESADNYAEQQAATTIPKILETLELPQPETEDSGSD